MTMMVPQPSRTLDLQRKEELLLQKQIRQSTCKVKNNLPTLIEASPDFNSKKLPYLPYLPDSVQSIASLQYDDTSESIVTDDLPSLYSLPHKFRSESRCSSITFDLTDAEGYNRNRSKSKNKKQKERKEYKEESQANIFAREEPDLITREPVLTKEKEKGKKEEGEEEESYLSMWSCRRCTLENPLQEAVCLACGGSRLSSIGDIEVPKTVEPRNLVNLIRVEEEEEVVVEEGVNTKNNSDQPMPRWKCRVCTLENEALNYFCDACNSPSPLQAARKNNTKEEVINRAGADPNTELGIIFSKAVRYLGIACFCLIILCAMFNMVSSLIHTLQIFLRPNQNIAPQQTLLPKIPGPPTLQSPPVTDINEGQEIRVSSESHNSIVEDGSAENYAELSRLTDEGEVRETDEAEEASDDNVDIYQIFYENFGILPIIFLIYWPLFLYLIARICKVGEQVTQPRVPQPF